MSTKRFSLNSSRTSKQGSLINVGKESEEYKALTNTMTMAAEDMAEIGLAEGQMAVVRTEFGEAEFKCAAGKIPLGMIFVPY
jgi:formylmethanofuran dehydrogenase subunit D